MAFANLDRDTKKRTSSSTYLKIQAGSPATVLILDEHPVLLLKHWISDGTGRRVGISCLDSDCPICERNNQINWNREHPDYIARQKRYRVNVLDLTPVRRCPSCSAPYAITVNRCAVDGCGADLSEVAVEPLSDVKILERGPRLMESLNTLEAAPYFVTGKPEKLQSYPIMLIATGSGREMNITAVPQPRVDVDFKSLELFDLEGGVKLTREEISFLMEGGAYRDIWEARNAAKEIAKEDVDTEASKIPF